MSKSNKKSSPYLDSQLSENFNQYQYQFNSEIVREAMANFGLGDGRPAPQTQLIRKLGDIGGRPTAELAALVARTRAATGRSVPLELGVSEDDALGEQRTKLRGLEFKEKGNDLFKRNKFDEARQAYIQSIRCNLEVPEDYPLPHPTASIPAIAKVQSEQFVDIVACANNIAQSYVKEGNNLLALQWLEELHCMYESYSRSQMGNAYPWKEFSLLFEEFFTTQIKAGLRLGSIYDSLLNTAGAYSAIWTAFKVGMGLVPQQIPYFPPTIEALRKQANVDKYTNKRHPDPSDVRAAKMVDPELQIRGVWKKLKVGAGKDGTPTSRLGSPSFVYKGTYYVFNGEHGTGKVLKDGWALKLNDLSAGWRKVPAPPDESTKYCSFAVQGSKAYLFTGNPMLSVFDLEKEKWSMVSMVPDPAALQQYWDIFAPGLEVSGYTVSVHGGKMYVFGGTDRQNEIGRNTLMALDLKTLRWEMLSGTAELKPDSTLPGPREHACSWVSGDKLYITLGSASRSTAKLVGRPEGADTDYAYVDLWSYSFATKSWTQEKYSSNGPCLRAEAAHTFNESWKKAVVFGGYCTTLALNQVRQGKGVLGYSYFSDTFVWEGDTKQWKQVLTRGFPTYRAHAQMVTDPDSGRTYLFGGYTNTEYTPSTRSAVVQSFNDLWELCIDISQSDFNSSDFDDADPRFAALGPWKTCFNCESVGRWMQCAGSCGGAAAFCGKECQKAAWAEHKRVNGCKNLKKT